MCYFWVKMCGCSACDNSNEFFEYLNTILHGLQRITRKTPKGKMLSTIRKKIIYTYLYELDLDPRAIPYIAIWLVSPEPGNQKKTLDELFELPWYNRIRTTDMNIQNIPPFVFEAVAKWLASE